MHLLVPFKFINQEFWAHVLLEFLLSLPKVAPDLTAHHSAIQANGKKDIEARMSKMAVPRPGLLEH